MYRPGTSIYRPTSSMAYCRSLTENMEIILGDSMFEPRSILHSIGVKRDNSPDDMLVDDLMKKKKMKARNWEE